MAKLRVLHLLGIDDSGRVTVSHLGPDLNRSRLTYLGNVELTELMRAPDIAIHTMVRGGMAITGMQLPPMDVLVNAVCDCDTNEMALNSVLAVIAQVGKPVVNDPVRIQRTGRDHMYEELHDVEGMHFPKTVRLAPRSKADVAALVDEGEIALPFLFREAGAHGGHKLNLVTGTSPAELRELDCFAFDGRSYYATEFVDFVSPDGRYRKYRMIVIGGRPFPRHLIITDSWNVHVESRAVLMNDDAELRAEEEHHIRSFDPDAWPVFRRIWERLELDYFGVDFSLAADGSLIVFEINCCCRPLITGMALGDHHEVTVAGMRQAFTDLLWERAGLTRG